MLIGMSFVIILGSTLAKGQANKQAAPNPQASSNPQQIERGRYVVEIGGCNDCHTAGYADAGGKAPESERLKGDTLGYRGPWGTTYPTNLRLSIGKMTEDQWLKYAKSLMTRPPMPWFNVRAMNDGDLRALYAYIKSLGASGNQSPAFLPPDKQPKAPYIQWPMPGQR
jgi:mono/diheme cytochrome c family protein